MHFPNVSDSPISEKIFSDSVENLAFSSAKISDDLFLVIDQKFAPLFGKFFIFPYFFKFPPEFVKFTCFLYTFCVFRLPPTLTMMHLCITQCTYWTPLRCIADPRESDYHSFWTFSFIIIIITAVLYSAPSGSLLRSVAGVHRMYM